ncbi:MAG: hypothetical protein RLZZ399_599 [Verrucomicrobiota bacterium]|jgi:16S rRNA (uracil1498-N3)-methyltransferase
MARFFAPPNAWRGDMVSLDAAESRHACEVLRLKSGDSLSVFDGAGRIAAATLLAAHRQGADLRLESVSTEPRAAVELTLVQAVPKGKLMEWILEKATELGATRVVPVLTERTVVQVDSGDALRKQEKWQRVVLEACKQCGQNWLPRIDAPVSLKEFLRGERPAPCTVFGSLYPGAVSFPEALADAGMASGGSDPTGAMALIGPEGDFTETEARDLMLWGARPVTFGPIVLRAETAAFYSLSVLRHSLRGIPRAQ